MACHLITHSRISIRKCSNDERFAYRLPATEVRYWFGLECFCDGLSFLPRPSSGKLVHDQQTITGG